MSMTDKGCYFEGYVDDLNIPTDWVEVSYGDDTCPSWNYKGYQIFIDTLDKERSEHPDAPRFSIIYEALYGDHHSFVKSADTFEEVLQFLQKNDATNLDQLTAELNEWLDKEGLPQSCALELQMVGDITDEQRTWLEAFSTRWEHAEKVHYAPTKVKRVFSDKFNIPYEPTKGFAYVEEGKVFDENDPYMHWHIYLEDDKYQLCLDRDVLERDATPEGLKELESFLFEWIADECGYSKVILEGEG